jgi:hypothetical protein
LQEIVIAWLAHDTCSNTVPREVARMSRAMTV